MMDITEKKRSELALEESEQRYKSLFEHKALPCSSQAING
jgi:hypothetical protein